MVHQLHELLLPKVMEQGSVYILCARPTEVLLKQIPERCQRGHFLHPRHRAVTDGKGPAALCWVLQEVRNCSFAQLHGVPGNYTASCNPLSLSGPKAPKLLFCVSSCWFSEKCIQFIECQDEKKKKKKNNTMCLQWSLKRSNTCKSEMKSGYFWVSARHTDGSLRQQRRVSFGSVPGLKNVVCCWWRYEPCTNVHSRKQPKDMGTEDFQHQRLSVSLPDLLGTVWEMCHLRGEGFSCEMWWIWSPECPKGGGGRQKLSSLDAAACPESLHLGDLQWFQRHHRSLQRCEIPVVLNILFFPLLHIIGEKLWSKLYKMNSWGLWLA